MIGTSRIEVFDVDAEWEEVVPHLDEEGVVHALDCGMRAWCVIADKPLWNPSLGPHFFSVGGDWTGPSLRVVRKSGECEAPRCKAGCAGVNEVNPERSSPAMSELPPLPYTPNWYRCIGAHRYLAAWHCAIGERMFPQLEWHIVYGSYRSAALGTGTSNVIVDVLWAQGDCSLADLGGLWNSDCWYTLEQEFTRLKKVFKEAARLMGRAI